MTFVRSNITNMSDASWYNITTTPQIKTNSSITTESCVLHMMDVFTISGYAVVFTLGVIGNGIVVLTFASSWSKGPIIELLIIYLAFFDFLASIFGPLPFVYWIVTCHKRWDFGWIGCKVLPALCRIFTDISIGIILTMAIDRCRSIATPLRNRFSRNTIHMSVCAIIFLSCMWELYYVFALYIKDDKCTVAEVSDPRYSYPLIILTALRDIAFVVIFSITTLAVYIKLKSADSQKLLRSSQGYKQVHIQRSRVMKMLVAMAIIFAITVIPRDIFHLTITVSWMHSNGIPYTLTVIYMNNILKLLQVSNSMYNVFIYGKMHEHFWHNLKIVICRVKGNRHLTYSTTIRRNKRHNSSTSSTAFRRQSLVTEVDRRERLLSGAGLNFSTREEMVLGEQHKMLVRN